MSEMLRLLTWVGLALAGLGLLVLAWGRAFPLAPESFNVRRAEAIEIAVEQLEAMNALLTDDMRYRVSMRFDPQLERRLLSGLSRRQLEAVRGEMIGRRLAFWQVLVERDGKRLHQVDVGLDGSTLGLRLWLEKTGAPAPNRQLIRRAEATLQRLGWDPAELGSSFIVDQGSKVKEVRFPWLGSAAQLDGLQHGVAVIFDGSRQVGFDYWTQDTRYADLHLESRAQGLLKILRYGLIGVLFLVLVAFWFRFYDAGRMRLRRSLHFAELVVAAGIPWLALELRQAGGFGRFEGALMAVALLASVVFMGFVAFLTSGVGEALAREQWQHRLAAFEAVFQGRFRNATVARAALHGLAVGALGAGAAVTLSLPLAWFGGTPLVGPVLDLAMAGGEPAFGLVFREIFLLWVPLLLNFLVVVPFLFAQCGPRLGFLLSWVATAILIPAPVQLLPVWMAVPWMLVLASIPLVLFLGSDLLAAMLSVMVMRGLISFLPLIQSADAVLQVGVWVTLAAVVGPALWCLRWLYSDRFFTYSYDPRSEIPAEVLQRVADRERQRVELSTAKEVQKAIMPQVPERVAGLQVAHAYLPASEIGGDFYDVYPLDDGRVAFTLGDVAGHGVSSGLIMSTVRGALRVHFRYEPDVEKVFESINSLLYELAERRLLTTLVYGLYEPASGRLRFAVSGHVVWCLRAGGELVSWEPKIFPLGARPTVRTTVIETELGPGDTLILTSDGLIEATGGQSEEPYGYDRLEATVRSMKGASAADLLAGLLSSASRFVAGHDLDDDFTVLVLQPDPSPASLSQDPVTGETESTFPSKDTE